MKTLLGFILASFFSFSSELLLDEFNVDLNLDQQNERIQLLKKNGLDYLVVFSHDQKLLFQHELIPMGKNSQIKKIRLVKVHLQHQCLLTYFDQGQTNVKSLKRSIRLMSFCFHVNNVKKVAAQDLGYLFWDYQAVSSYQVLESNILLNQIFWDNNFTTILSLKNDHRIRSWVFNIPIMQWSSLPERMFAEYAIKLVR